MHLHIGLLSVIVLLHSIFGIASILSIISFSFNIKMPFINTLSFLTVLSFLVYQRCVAIDIYEYVLGDTCSTEIPDSAKDNYIRNKITGTKSEDYTKHRLDILNNNNPIVNKDENEVNIMIKRKMHYIIVNIILTVIFIIKINKNILPALLLWLFYVFPL